MHYFHPLNPNPRLCNARRTNLNTLFLQLFVFICHYLLTQEAECAYVIILMAIYWCTEALPLAVTAILPALLFPLFGIMESKDVSSGESAHCPNDFFHACTHGMSCLLRAAAVPGVHAVPEGHQHALRGGSDGRGGGGTLEPAQAHRTESAALCRGASSAVSGSCTIISSVCFCLSSI